ncbi:TonB-dependent siderophore receptor [Massilia sp. METH4]|uniref:TonB-dependent siderophore receptor n=1 Tax=Massilia sp. METH4 TaxID=3123041 RepID=UPI0030D1D32F
MNNPPETTMHDLSRPARARLNLTTLAQALALGLLAPAGAALALDTPAQAQARRHYDIPAGPLEPALNRLGREAGILLAYPADLTTGVRSEGARGAYTVAEALARLLRNTGIVAVPKADGGYTLARQRAAGGAQEGGAAHVMPSVIVDGVREGEDGPGSGYAARRSAGATKFDVPVTEIPQSISIVTPDQLATLKPVSLGEALAYTPGIVADPGYTNSFDVFYSRGFPLSDTSGGIYRDGLKFGGAGWASGQQEVYGLERLELIKGAASVLYGAAAPGGVLNTVTKRPTADMVNELRAAVGSHGRREAAADVGGALGPAWSWRVTALARNDETQIDHIPNNSRYFAPALKWQPTPATSLTLLAHVHDRRTAYQYSLPAEGTLIASPYGKLPRGRFVGEPDFDRQDARQYGGALLFEHAFSSSTRLRHGTRYLNSENHVQFIGLDGPLDDDPRRQWRSAYDEWERTRGFSSDTSIEQRWNGLGMAHTALAGFDYARHKPESQWALAAVAPLDLFAPAYGARPEEMTQVPSYSTRAIATRKGLYVQDQARLGERWIFLLGARHDWASDARSPLAGTPRWSTERTEATTGRAGAVYQAGNGLAPFFSFSQSFEPQSGVDTAGNRFKPTRGEQAELGLRWEIPSTGLLLSATVYTLTQQNVVTSDPRTPAVRMQTGEVKSEGAEFEAKGRVGKHVDLIASWAYTDARTTRSLRPADIGVRQPSVPRQQAALWGDVGLGAFGWPGLRAGLGARFTGSMTDVRGTNARVPSSTTFDALLAWEARQWRASLNFANLADRDTLACSYGSCLYGEGRRVTATLGYLW